MQASPCGFSGNLVVKHGEGVDSGSEDSKITKPRCEYTVLLDSLKSEYIFFSWVIHNGSGLRAMTYPTCELLWSVWKTSLV